MATHTMHRIVGGLAAGLLSFSLVQAVSSPTRADTPDTPDTTSASTSLAAMTTTATSAPSAPSATTGATSGAVVLALEPWLCTFFPRFSWCNSK